MNLYYVDEHTSCTNYISHTQSGFKLLKIQKGEMTSDQAQISDIYNLLIFVVEGEIEISCNEHMNHRFVAGEFIFIPRSTIIASSALETSKLIVLLFDYTVANLCDKHTLNQYATECSDIEYGFRGLQFRSPLTEYLELLEMFLEAGVNCIHLHEIKQKELFIIFRTAYSRREITELFYPILGNNIDFKSSFLAHCKFGYTIKEIASAMSLSEVSFSRRFKQEFEVTYHKWMLKHKAQHIKHKLTYPQTTIKDIIYEFNFANFSHFNRFCQEHFGCSPSELAKSLRPNKTIK